MPWLVRDGRVLASLEVADSRRARRQGLLGRDDLTGALLLPGVRSVHTVGMRFPIDVAYLDGEGRVLDLVRLRPWRVSRPRWRAEAALEAEAGSFDRWDLALGDVLDVTADG